MKNSIKLVALLLTAGFCSACTRQLPFDTRSRISLKGNWGLQLDTAGTGITPDWPAKPCTDSLFLPGTCLLYTSPSPRDGLLSRMPSSA